MSYLHSFDTWHKTIKHLTEQAQSYPKMQYYILYTNIHLSIHNDPCHLLLERQEQAQEFLLESLDIGRVVHRVGQTSQLTGKRMFVWPDSLPRHITWAVVPKRGKRFGNEPATSPLLKFYEWDKLYLVKSADGIPAIHYVLQIHIVRLD